MVERTVENNEVFCVVPWLHTYLGPENKRNLCSVADANFDDSELEKTWNSTHMKDIRKNLLNGVEIKECHRCPSNTNVTYRV